MKKAKKKIELDLDNALEQIAEKLRPSANMPGCGNTQIYNTAPSSSGTPAPQCGCWCCSHTNAFTCKSI